MSQYEILVEYLANFLSPIRKFFEKIIYIITILITTD